MKVALLTTFKASRKEPLHTQLARIHAAFHAAGEGEPAVRFRFADSPLPGSTSMIDRVLKRQPSLEPFTATVSAAPGIPAVRQITNMPGAPKEGHAVPFATLLAVAEGVPRSFPLHAIALDFHSPAFGEATEFSPGLASSSAGILVGDSWWVSGRSRTLMALTVVEGDPAAKKLPPLPAAVQSILEACGAVKKTVQVPCAAPAASPQPLADPVTLQAVREVTAAYRARLAEIMERAAMPHSLPLAAEIRQAMLGVTSGPKKPALVAAFQPLGYTCRGESGMFTLRRRTAGNLTVEAELDVGTWSNSLTGSFHIYGLGFTAVLPLPVTARAIGGGQYPIGDAESWGRIVANLAALVAEYDRSFVPAVEEAAGPSPEWYTPDS